jgi:hypothetical protein
MLILGMFVILAVAVALTIFLMRPTSPTRAVMVPVVDENNLDSLMSDLAEKAEKSMFVTYMNMIWHFADGASASYDAMIGNSESNHYPFYFDIALKDTGEIIYTSSLVPVGMNLKEVILEKTLSKGEYAAILTYHLVEDNEVLESNLGFNITLVVER